MSRASSTTQTAVGSRRSSLQMGHSSASATFQHRTQKRTLALASVSACANRLTSSAGHLQQMEGDALCRLGPDAWQATELVDQHLHGRRERRRRHQRRSSINSEPGKAWASRSIGDTTVSGGASTRSWMSTSSSAGRVGPRVQRSNAAAARVVASSVIGRCFRRRAPWHGGRRPRAAAASTSARCCSHLARCASLGAPRSRTERTPSRRRTPVDRARRTRPFSVGTTR